METRELVELWRHESELRTEASRVQREVLNDNSERRGHEWLAMQLAFDREMARFELEREKLEHERHRFELEDARETAQMELDQLRLELVRDGKVSDLKAVDDMVNELRKPWIVRAEEALARAARAALEVVVLALFAMVLMRLCDQS